MAEGIRQLGAGDWRRLRACPGCEYSLETLPAEGVCPECGRAYDQRYIVLTGLGRGRWDVAAGGTWRGLVGQVVGVAVLLWVFMSSHGFGSPQLLAVGVLTGVVLAAQMYARVFSAREPGMQLWMSAEGVAQVPSTPEARRAQAISEGAGLLFLPVFYGVFVYETGLRGGWGPVVVVGVALGAAGLARWSMWRRTPRVKGGGDVPGLWRWGVIERIQVKELPGERARIRCMVTRAWWWIKVRKDWVIDIEVECPAEVAGKLGRQMVGWCPGAGE